MLGLDKTEFPVLNPKQQKQLNLSLFGTEVNTTCYSNLQEKILYMSRTEVSNGQYVEYLKWLKSNGTKEEFEKAYPDTSVWIKELKAYEPYTKYYLNHIAYKDYPLVGISQQQARRFCIWIQDSLNKFLRESNKFDIAEVIVRLPSTNEWVTAARSDLHGNAIFPWEGESERWGEEGKNRDRGLLRLNYKRGFPRGENGAKQLNDDGYITTPIESYWPNKIGLFNMSGNVAEWVEESGKTKGGAYNLPLYYSRLDAEGFWDGDSSAKASIGFRYVVEVVKLKTKKKLENFEASPRIIFGNFVVYLPRKTGDTTSNNLFAGVTEVSNKQYLQFLLENPNSNLRITNENWKKFFRYSFFETYGQHEYFYDYPVVNISYESAIKYCEWLTIKYNNEQKRKYKKVVFRLPTSAEWENAARGGRLQMQYPWGGPYTRNSRGCFLANYFPLEERFLKADSTGRRYFDYPNDDKTISRVIDGGILPVNGSSYFPNEYGIYNMSGNVAEMVQEKGISKGGSWNSFVEYIAIASHETYTEANPTLGFRVFLEVLEE